ncbi:MAG: InlB B-repeat-containing protein [Treponema sp.]|jgi:uncharacterized repeat protein (TIGR02543 family)|nr:InlB B-repeat-containing protein [Treponema sp.]
MKKIKYGIIFGSLFIGILVIASVILLASCNNLFDLPGDQPRAGYGRVTINITGDEAGRTALPNTELFTFKYFFNDIEKYPQSGTKTFTLEYGTYTVKVQASDSGTIVAEGIASVTIDSSTSSSGQDVPVKLSPTTNTGKGTFKYTITNQIINGTLNISLKKWPTLATDEISDSTIESATLQLDDGSYVLTITVNDDTAGKYAGFVTAVHIYPGITTEFKKTFTDNDLILRQKEYTVTFDKNGGDTEASPQTKTVKSPPSYTIDALPTTPPTKANNNLKEWNTKDDGTGTVFNASTDVTTLTPPVPADPTALKVYAIWDPVDMNKYQINFKSNHSDTSGAVDADPPYMEVDPDSSVTALPDDPTRTHYTFSKWTMQANGSGGDFTIAYQTPSAAPDLTTRNIDVFAQWTGKTYTVTFNKNDGTSVAPETKTVIYSPTATVALPTPPPTREHYEFKGWFDTDNDSGGTEFTDTTLVTGDKTVYARWEGKTYKVTFDRNNTDALAGDTVTDANPKEIEVTYPTSTVGSLPTPPKRAGYTFEGWFTSDNTQFTASTPVIATITVKAKWELIAATTYTVTFNKNNADATGATEANPTTKTVTSPATNVGTLPTAPTRSEGWGAGMTFDGWNTEADGSGTAFDETTPVTGDIPVYAKWKYVAGTPQVVGDTLVHMAPAMTTNDGEGVTQGTWGGSVEASTGIVTYSGGAVRYMFPSEASTYDFVKLEYISTGGGVILKKGASSEDYYSGKNEEGNRYPTLPTNSSGSLEFVLKSAKGTIPNPAGIALQYNASADINIKFTKATFSKGTKYTISFDTNYAAGETIPSKQVLAETTIGEANLPDPDERDNYKFIGWNTESNGSGTTYSKASIMPANNISLFAQWADDVQANPITVTVVKAQLTDIGTPTDVDIVDGGSGYTWTHDGYNQAVAFKVTIPTNIKLSNYDKISFTLDAVPGSAESSTFITRYKNCNVAGGSSVPSFSAPDANAQDSPFVTNYTGSPQNIGSESGFPYSMEFTIDKSKDLTKSLEGEIYLAVFINAGSGATYTVTNFKIYQE